jgi:hypothetical protein
MLQRFLFIGLGGSGGKTLRVLRQELQHRLREVGWEGPMPMGWQFLWIDVPAEPDGNEPGLPPQLPAGSYLGIGTQNISFGDLDRILVGRGPRAIEHTAGWRPDPAEARHINISSGAGQYRSVGRIVTAAGLPQIVDALKASVNRLATSVDELEQVSQVFGNAPSNRTPPPQAVVVSSIAGGAGAGLLLDVSDALRMVEADNWSSESVAMLFTPDVFVDLKADSRGGVQGNALATVSELMAGYWNGEQAGATEFALLEAAQIAVPVALERRGPRYPFLVGRANGEIVFKSQNEVYQAVGRSLAAWVTSATLQDSFKAYLQGNWVAAGSNIEDDLGLNRQGDGTPFSSYGYATVDLGRERFGRYSAERLAREGVEHLLRGHVTDKVLEELETAEAAVEQAALGYGVAFLEKCGLRELGPNHNQILDAIRGGDMHEARREALREVRVAITSGTKSGRTQFTSAELIRAITTQLEGRWSHFAHAQREADEGRAKVWIEEVQDRIARVTAGRLGNLGAAITVKILDNAMDELLRDVVPELRHEAESFRHLKATTAARISSAVAGFDKLLPDNPLIDKAVKEATDSLWAEAEIGLTELTASLIRDLVEHFLRPLRDAVERSRSGLETEERGALTNLSVIQQWPYRATIPESFRPAPNEILLEPVEDYPDTFRRQVRASVGSPDEGGALIEAVQQVIQGSRIDGAEQDTITITTRWVPADQVLRTTTGARSGAFRVRLGGDDLLRRATDWVRDPDTAFGRHLDTTLTTYLDPENVDPADHKRRLDRYRAGLRQALVTSQPLVDVHVSTLSEVHKRTESTYARITSTIPFADDAHPARQVTHDVLLDLGVEEREIAGLFGEAKTSRVEIASLLTAPYQPVVFTSLMQPIASEWAGKRDSDPTGFWQWRRTRPLEQFIPAAPEVRRHMVRGWFVGRILNLLRIVDPIARPAEIFVPTYGFVPFPHPLLGAPVTDGRDLLPALLESLAIAMVEVSSRGMRDAMRPYHRLIALGQPEHGVAVDVAHLPPALHRWTMEGKVEVDAPIPVEINAGPQIGTSAERGDAIGALLERLINTYEYGSDAALDPRTSLNLSRGWELRQDLARALRELRGQLARSLDRVPDADPDAFAPVNY